MSAFRPLDAFRAIGAVPLSCRHKAVLWALLMFVDERGGPCWPSHSTLARKAGMSKSSLKSTLAELYALGHVSKTHRKCEGTREADSNVYHLHLVSEVGLSVPHVGQDTPHVGHDTAHGGADGGPQVGQDTAGGGSQFGQYLPIELPNGTAHGTIPPSLTLERDAETKSTNAGHRKHKGTKPRKHSDQETADKAVVLDHFVACFETVKGCKPKNIDAADNAAAFKLAKLYGPNEAGRIIDRAFQDSFVVERNCTLRFIASKADTFRGAVKGATNHKVHNPVQDPGDGSAWPSLLKARVQ